MSQHAILFLFQYHAADGRPISRKGTYEQDASTGRDAATEKLLAQNMSMMIAKHFGAIA